MHDLYRRFTAALGLVATCGLASATPVLTIDQQSTNGNTYAVANTVAGQTFMPTLTSMNVAFFSLAWAGGLGSSGGTAVVDLFAGTGFGGTLLGTSATRNFGVSGFENVQFDFASTISLTPDSVYTLRVRATSGSFYFERVGSDYTRGTFVDQNGTPEDADVLFSEGLLTDSTSTGTPTTPPSIPEPAGLSLALAALAGLGISRRRR